MTKLYYVAYGSNLHPRRLGERIPSAALVHAVMLRRYRVAFHKRGADATGKCNLLYTGAPEDVAYGALYSLSETHKAALDRIEGPGYRVDHIDLTVAGEFYPCFTYIAEDAYVDDSLRPFDWYRSLVSLGAEHLGLPQAYVRRLREVPAVHDTHAERRLAHAELVRRIADINRRHRLTGEIRESHAHHHGVTPDC
jgi:hypothetical protein